MLSSTNHSSLILGNGYVGQRLSYLLSQLKTNHQVSSTKTPSAVNANDYVTPLTYDLDNKISAISNTNVWCFFPPSSVDTTDHRMRLFLQHYQPESSPAKVVYISTTGIYGNCNGEWVTESKQAEPSTDRAKRRLDAEQTLQHWAEQTNNHYIILRVAGIYGPNRLPLKRLQEQQPMISEQEAPWSNRIHVDDLVTICHRAMLSPITNEIYNVADGNPTNMAHYFNTLADLANLPRPPLVALNDHANGLSQGMLSYLKESRRIDSAKVLRDLSITLEYPDLITGLTQALAASAD